MPLIQLLFRIFQQPLRKNDQQKIPRLKRTTRKIEKTRHCAVPNKENGFFFAFINGNLSPCHKNDNLIYLLIFNLLQGFYCERKPILVQKCPFISELTPPVLLGIKYDRRGCRFMK
jgi:hypothetical protein